MTRYTPVVARTYDVVSLEWPLYRPGRLAGIAGLRLRPGAQVLDLGCGTGLNVGPLLSAVGSTGRVVGVDASPAMLARARRKAELRGWRCLDLVQADLATLDVRALRSRLRGGAADAVLATYALSLVPQWRRAWQLALAVLAPGARVAVVDLALPTGAGRLLAPLAAAACAAGGSDPHAAVWTAVEQDCTDVQATSRWAGHVQVRAGTARGHATS